MNNRCIFCVQVDYGHDAAPVRRPSSSSHSVFSNNNMPAAPSSVLGGAEPYSSVLTPSAPPLTTEEPVAAAMANLQVGSRNDRGKSCIICYDAQAIMGFLHGESVHTCCCQACAEDYKDRGLVQSRGCPLCRQAVERIIRSHDV
jgi:hypothetical protein